MKTGEKKIIFHVDLDNTILYSYKHDIGADKRCVEVCQGKEISFITQETFRLLREVKSRAVIVPTTTRTTEQYSRINLGAGAFQYALTCNGGVLLVDGAEDADWYRESLKRISRSKSSLARAMEFLEKDRRRTFAVRFIKELFVFTKCGEPEAVAAELEAVLDMETVDVFSNGAKVYVVPKALGKGNAVDRFREYINAAYVMAAGDSEFDISMLEAADYGIAAPTLVQRYLDSNKCFVGKMICPPADRLYAEVVLDTVLQFLYDRNL